MSVLDIDDRMTKGAAFEEQVEAARPRGAPLGSYRARRLLRLGIIGLLLLIGLAVLGHWLINRWTHVYVVDSRISADVITMSSEVEGRVTSIAVVPGDGAHKGELL